MPIDPLRPHSPKNLAYIHGYCQPGQAEFYESELEVDSPFDLFALLKRLNEGKLPPPDRKYKFQPLTEYFRIVFERKEEKGEVVNLPAFLSGRVPPNAKAELENFFEFIRNKYGL
jgi:hypothetical protein